MRRTLHLERMTAIAAITLAALILAAAPGPAELQIGSPAPDFSAQRLGGGTLSLTDLRGHPVLLNFWSPTCPPCAIEMPELEKLHRRYLGRGLRIVGVTGMDPPLDLVRRFQKETRVTYPIVLDPGGKIGDRYLLQAHPTSVLLDAEGVVRYVNKGYLRGEEKEIEAAIGKVLGPVSRVRAR